MDIEYRTDRRLPCESVIALYKSVEWSSAKKPDTLLAALAGSHSVVTAWEDGKLVGLGNAISDGCLVVYYPHLVVHPDYQGKGVGREIMKRMGEKYKDFHQQTLVADGGAIDFYEKQGFTKTGSCISMWVYHGDDHA